MRLIRFTMINILRLVKSQRVCRKAVERIWFRLSENERKKYTNWRHFLGRRGRAS